MVGRVVQRPIPRLVNDDGSSRKCLGVYFPVGAKECHVNYREWSVPISASQCCCRGAEPRPVHTGVGTMGRPTWEPLGPNRIGVEKGEGKEGSPTSLRRKCRVERVEGEVFPTKERLRLIESGSRGAEGNSRRGASMQGGSMADSE